MRRDYGEVRARQVRVYTHSIRAANPSNSIGVSPQSENSLARSLARALTGPTVGP